MLKKIQPIRIQESHVYSTVLYSYFKKGFSCDLCFIARSALCEQAWFKICLLRTRKTFVGELELFGFGFLGAIQRKKPASISEYHIIP